MGGPSGFSAVKHSDILGAEGVAVCARSVHSWGVLMTGRFSFTAVEQSSALAPTDLLLGSS